MIIKHFELKKKNFEEYSLYLLYGKNEGLQKHLIEEYFTKNFDGEINKYEEGEILNNLDNVIQEILNKSLFSSKKILIISRSSDKIITFIKFLLEKELSDTKIILKSGVLEKRSKLRNIFEKEKNLVSIPVYSDETRNLIPIINDFTEKYNLKLSRESINLIIDRASGDRENLINELKKIYYYSISNKKIDFDTIKKLTNLNENYEVSELADLYLIKNYKGVAKILNESNYSDEDCVLILRTILNKSKRLLDIMLQNRITKDIEKVIANTKPPIFWKDKENVKKQIKTWDIDKLRNKIYEINEVELLVKTNTKNSLNIVSNFIFDY